jgi:hypothetical protein
MRLKYLEPLQKSLDPALEAARYDKLTARDDDKLTAPDDDKLTAQDDKLSGKPEYKLNRDITLLSG